MTIGYPPNPPEYAIVLVRRVFHITRVFVLAYTSVDTYDQPLVRTLSARLRPLGLPPPEVWRTHWLPEESPGVVVHTPIEVTS